MMRTRLLVVAAVAVASAIAVVVLPAEDQPAGPTAAAVPSRPAPGPAPDSTGRSGQDPVELVGVQSGVQHPPIPADSPAWRHDPGGFVPDHNFYGERSWDGVRMRVAGHIAVMERDRARLAARLSGGAAEAATV